MILADNATVCMKIVKFASTLDTKLLRCCATHVMSKQQMIALGKMENSALLHSSTCESKNSEHHQKHQTIGRPELLKGLCDAND
jgi:hypothetical protein